MNKFTKTIASVIAVLVLVAVVATSASAYTFTRSLTVGSRGDDVTALQEGLISKGYLKVSATGYFGNLTKAAVAAFQVANGVTPAVGYFGPKTQAVWATVMSGTSTGSTGSTSTGSTSSNGITTVGAEGTLSATASNAGLVSTAYEGDSMVAVLGAKVEAKNSDIAVQRVKLSLGTSTTIYNKIFKKLYVTDGSSVLASSDLNSSTVVKDGSTYYITIAGFNYLVKKGETKMLTIKADVYSSIDSGDLGSKTITLVASGLRGVDGAGVDQYAPTDAIARSTTLSADLKDSATLSISTNVNTPSTSDVVASAGSSENELDKLAVLAMDFKAEKDDVKITDLNVAISKAGTGAATASSTVYLYEGSTELDSTSVSSGVAVFSDLDYVVPRDTTKTLWVKVDIRNANGTVSQISASATSTGVTAENSRGDSITESGSATGETFYVRNVGPVFTLVSKTIEKSSTASQSNTSTSTAKATFTLKIKAVGGDITFGSVASGTPAFASSTSGFKIYKDGSEASPSVTKTVSYSIPSSGVVTSGIGSNSFKLQENNEVTIPVDYLFEGRTTAGALVSTGSYAVGLEGIAWSSNDGASSNTTNFMAGDTDWRTSAVSLP